MKIVIADDAEMMRNRVKDALTKFKDIEIVGEAKNGEEALTLILNKKPDFVILDIRMPGMSGIEVLKELRQQDCTCRICVFTNYPYPQYKQKCMTEGADYFFDKSEGFQSLIDTLDRQARLGDKD